MRTLFLLLMFAVASLGSGPDRFGLPACSGRGLELAVKHAFAVCHSADFKTPAWTIHEITPSHSAGATQSKRLRFRRDLCLSTRGASKADYRNSGFSGGHLVPAREWPVVSARRAFGFSCRTPCRKTPLNSQSSDDPPRLLHSLNPQRRRTFPPHPPASLRKSCPVVLPVPRNPREQRAMRPHTLRTT